MSGWAPLVSRGEVREMVVNRVPFVHTSGTKCDYILRIITSDDAFEMAVKDAKGIAHLVSTLEPDSVKPGFGINTDELEAILGTVH